MRQTMDLDALVVLMPFAAELGLTLDEASADRVVAQTTQVQTVRHP
ncbi:MAG TPA: hypothetical protein VH089_22360 [Streptosporangiaceae bacterium]|nr:hypothetical protein [Streptosporangiaceae bacterium]